MKRCIIIVYLVFQIFLLNAQNQQIEVVGRFEKSRILLRWAPSNHIDWLLGNKYGYKVWKFTLTNGKQIIEKPDSVYLGLFEPALLNNWQPYSDSSTFAVAAQTIYGDSLQVQTTSNGFLDLVNKSREQESRFSFAMICADQSFTVAKLMGLAFVDSNVNPANMYGYKVELNYSDSTRKLLDGYLVIDSRTGNFLPHPFGVTSQVYKDIIFIRVPFDPIKGYYSNFELEKSVDNKTFVLISGSNYYSVSTTNDDPYYYVFTDTVKQGNSKLYYRVRGKTLFDIYGPYSDTLQVDIKPSLNTIPIINNLIELNNKLQISWVYPDSTKSNLKGFKIFSGDDVKGPFKLLSDSIIDISETTLTVKKPSDYKYYRVAAVDKFNREYFSSSRLYQAIDSIPPVQPQKFEGYFDSTGIVYFSWQRNPDNDILGYQLLYSASKKSEFSLLNKGVVLDTVYSYPFTLNTLETKLYFKLVACDTRYNVSIPSEIIEIVKPDTIPPSPPLLMVETDSLGNVIVKVSPSSSSDIAKHVIYFANSSNATPVEIFNGKIVSDTAIVVKIPNASGVMYCTAIDFSGRKGTSSKIPLYIKDNKENFNIELKANALIDEGEIELIWNIIELKGSIMIFRKTENSNYNLIATIDAGQGRFTDKNVVINTKYLYKLIYSPLKGNALSGVLLINYK